MADFDLTAEITAVLKEYTGDVMDKVSAAVEDCGKSMTKDIRQARGRQNHQQKVDGVGEYRPAVCAD